jgi:hypothetical protein
VAAFASTPPSSFASLLSLSSFGIAAATAGGTFGGGMGMDGTTGAVGAVGAVGPAAINAVLKRIVAPNHMMFMRMKSSLFETS